MPYFFAQLLAQLPIGFLAGALAAGLMHGAKTENVPLTVALAFAAAPVVALLSLYAHRRINASFDLPLPESISVTRAIAFGSALSCMTLILAVGFLVVSHQAVLEWSGVQAAQVISGVGIGLLSGTVEEVLFRGVIQRKLSDWLGPLAGLAISGMVFAESHLVNPGATAQNVVLLGLFGMVLLGLTYWLTSNLYACISAHAVWNCMLWGVLGGAVSGYASKGVLVFSPASQPLVSGGQFGLEGSVFTPLAAAIAFAILYPIFFRRSEWKKYRLRKLRHEVAATIHHNKAGQAPQ